MRLIPLAALAIGLVAAGHAARAAEPAPIHGSDVMGDKTRSGPDGWSWAPQTRDQVPSGATNQTAANGHPDVNRQPGGGTGTKLAPGDDPGTPAPTDAHGPGTIDAGAAHKP